MARERNTWEISLNLFSYLLVPTQGEVGYFAIRSDVHPGSPLRAHWHGRLRRPHDIEFTWPGNGPGGVDRKNVDSRLTPSMGDFERMGLRVEPEDAHPTVVGIRNQPIVVGDFLCVTTGRKIAGSRDHRQADRRNRH